MQTRPIPGYPGCVVTIDGDVLLPDGSEAPLVEAKKVHPKAILPTPGGPVRVEVRRLVWSSWRGGIPKGFLIGHLNGNRFDNSVENLSLVPRKKSS